ncbi:hypothetical protein D5086_018572 [Populus alba]|uniref:Uncharacterized protein n=1 Tax=Populus alba TaxID=43335 RepID=A0ACC4BQ47_POPAL
MGLTLPGSIFWDGWDLWAPYIDGSENKVFTVKVHLSCCSRCTLRAKEKLQKIKGVNSITIDTAKDLVIVSGSVEPGVILEKFAEWGKKAELFSFQKEPMESGGGHDKDETNLNKNYYRKSDSVPGAVPANRFFHDNPNIPISMYGRPRQPVPPQPMYMPRPPFLPPYGGMQPGAAAAPSHSVNPMIHYTSYDDNYRHCFCYR